ncbi:EutP/PduV family microcompartment system protein [Neobacillus sp. YIM B02564]|uniref:EutP/PduV family microcompartment system protein n=1 Tax=Neobacillus paridis TaxID=2803862 RepID=A0ABS1TJV2_9BACI|nr:EutP/PduV family microcompartment system protein [Neobacillus paridis]MBL4951591.1 EutP/PduV family microcompartment system protein [Neobacillus paridis]
MRKIILIGKTGSGKTTLCQRLHGEQMEYQKTQAVQTFENAIDTPGEYIENRFYYNAITITAADADVIGLIQDCTEQTSLFPPLFAAMFPKPIIGIVTKVDLAKDPKQIEAAREYLRMAGAEKIIHISVMTGQGIDEILQYLDQE